jgi:hypothetical protein
MKMVLISFVKILLDALIDNRSSKMVDPFELEDRVEKLLIYHANLISSFLMKIKLKVRLAINGPMVTF